MSFSVLLRLASILWCRATSDDYAANNLLLRMEPEGDVRPILHDVQFLNFEGRLRHAASLFMLSAPGGSLKGRCAMMWNDSVIHEVTLENAEQVCLASDGIYSMHSVLPLLEVQGHAPVKLLNWMGAVVAP